MRICGQRGYAYGDKIMLFFMLAAMKYIKY